MTNIELRNIIIRSKDYEEEFVRDQLSVILEERLERMEISFFSLPCLRQAKRIGVEKTNWVSALLARMPPDITQLIARDSKTRAGEIREHFVDEWAKFYEPSVLADKLDGYESVRSSVKKTSQPEMSLSNTSDSRSNIKKEHAIIKNDIQSQRYKLPFKQEPKQPTFKPTCYSCVEELGIPRGLRFRYIPAKENEKIDELQFVHIKCGNEILKAVIDTGAQISVVRADVVEGQSVDSGGTIQIMSAFGEREVTG
ncbi:CCHC-type domain-containing protein [Trichonephila clavipes]|nr:CCHC-type domain-containing protein [Trichonephila clavipes]